MRSEFVGNRSSEEQLMEVQVVKSELLYTFRYLPDQSLEIKSDELTLDIQITQISVKELEGSYYFWSWVRLIMIIIVSVSIGPFS